MKKYLPHLIFAALVICGFLSLTWADHAELSSQIRYPQVQDPGGVDITTTTAVAVGTNPALAVSTGAATYFYTSTGSISQFGVEFTTAFPKVALDNGLYWELYDDCSADIYVGFNALVSTNPTSPNYGRHVKSGNSWSINTRTIPWLVAGSTTNNCVSFTQVR